RLRIDDFERVLQRTRDCQVNGEPLDMLAEIAQLQCAASHLEPLEAAGGRVENEFFVSEFRRPVDLADRRQAIQIIYRKIMVAKAAASVQHPAGMRRRIEVEAKLRRCLVEHAVMHISENPAPAAGAERRGPQSLEP